MLVSMYNFYMEKQINSQKNEEKAVKMKTRPSKLTENWLKAAEKVLNRGLNGLVMTDEEIFSLTNMELPEKKRISDRTFERWKAGSQKHNAFFKRFVALIKRVRQIQKENLFQMLKEDKSAWQRWAWIIERKFPEWNIRQQIDLKGQVDKKIIFEEITYEKPEANKENKNTA